MDSPQVVTYSGLAAAVCGVLPFAAITAWRETVVVVIKRYAPIAVRTAVVTLTWLFADVIHELFPPLRVIPG